MDVNFEQIDGATRERKQNEQNAHCTAACFKLMNMINKEQFKLIYLTFRMPLNYTSSEVTVNYKELNVGMYA